MAVELSVKALNLPADRTNKVLFWPLFVNPSNQECFFPVFSFCCFAVACETRAAIFILPEFPCCITYESPRTLSFFSLETFEDSSSIQPNRTFSRRKVWRGKNWPRAKMLSLREWCHATLVVKMLIFHVSWLERTHVNSQVNFSIAMTTTNKVSLFSNTRN